MYKALKELVSSVNGIYSSLKHSFDSYDSSKHRKSCDEHFFKSLNASSYSNEDKELITDLHNSVMQSQAFQGRMAFTGISSVKESAKFTFQVFLNDKYPRGSIPDAEYNRLFELGNDYGQMLKKSIAHAIDEKKSAHQNKQGDETPLNNIEVTRHNEQAKNPSQRARP